MRILKPTELLHLQMAGGDFAMNKAVRVFLLWAIQLLTILIHVLQHPATVG